MVPLFLFMLLLIHVSIPTTNTTAATTSNAITTANSTHVGINTTTTSNSCTPDNGITMNTTISAETEDQTPDALITDKGGETTDEATTTQVATKVAIYGVLIAALIIRFIFNFSINGGAEQITTSNPAVGSENVVGDALLQVMWNDPPIDEAASSNCDVESSVIPACSHRRDKALPTTFFAQTTQATGAEPGREQHFFGVHQFTPNGLQSKFLVALTTKRPYYGCQHYSLPPRLTAIDEIKRKIYVLEPLFSLMNTPLFHDEIHGYILTEFDLVFGADGLLTHIAEGRSSYTVNSPMPLLGGPLLRPVRLLISPDDGQLRVILNECDIDNSRKCQLLFARLIIRDKCNASHKTFFWKVITQIHEDKFKLKENSPVLFIKYPTRKGSNTDLRIAVQSALIDTTSTDFNAFRNANYSINTRTGVLDNLMDAFSNVKSFSNVTITRCDGSLNDDSDRRHIAIVHLQEDKSAGEIELDDKGLMLGVYNEKVLFQLANRALPFISKYTEYCDRHPYFFTNKGVRQVLTKLPAWPRNLESNQWLEVHLKKVWRCKRDDPTSPRVKIETYPMQQQLTSRPQCVVCGRYADRHEALKRCRKCVRVFTLPLLRVMKPTECFCSRRCLQKAWPTHDTCCKKTKLGVKKRQKVLEKASNRASCPCSLLVI